MKKTSPQSLPPPTMQTSKSLAAAAESGAILLVDKASGWTSHDVVARTRRAFGTRKVGHAGTLDPLATGLLTLGIGPATRLLTHLVGLDKVYTATIRLGQATVTDDSEGDIIEHGDAEIVAGLIAEALVDPAALRAKLQAAAAQFTGEIEQVPTAVSAIKIDGKRAYDLVRQGEDVQLKARQVTVHRFEIDEINVVETEQGKLLDLAVTCEVSSGTYIRALARDLGKALGTLGHLTVLRRHSVGPFDTGQAVSLAALEAEAQAVQAGGAASLATLKPITPAAAASALFPVIEVTDEQATALGHGKVLQLEAADAPMAAAIDAAGNLIALVRVKRGSVRVVTGFPQQGAK